MGRPSHCVALQGSILSASGRKQTLSLRLLRSNFHSLWGSASDLKQPFATGRLFDKSRPLSHDRIC